MLSGSLEPQPGAETSDGSKMWFLYGLFWNEGNLSEIVGKALIEIPIELL